jgi:pSer/pThr/pTyr-binding forkhead associated (FHA) protein
MTPQDDLPYDLPDPEGPGGTRLENVEEVRRQLAGRPPVDPTWREPAPAAGQPGTPGLPPTTAFRPVHRPPMALLRVLFDGQDDGEVIPLRGERFVIGRTDGDLVVPHDAMMSGRHAEVTRAHDRGRWRWSLTDLRSTNGTYVRGSISVLQHEQEFLIGSRRYRFDAAPPGAAALAAPAGAAGAAPVTRGWQSVSAEALLPSFVELTPHGTGNRYFLDRNELWLGRDPARCTVPLADDPMVSPRHARLYRDAKNRWVLENAGSLNGVWVRVPRIAVDGVGQFQLGEQRFVLRVL